MKRIFNKIAKTILAPAIAAMVAGCSFLDVDPELGMTDDEVFGVLKNFKAYFNTVYGGQKDGVNNNILLGVPLYIDMSGSHLCFDSLTDASDCGALNVSQKNFKSGVLTQDVINNFSFAYNASNNRRPIAGAMFTIIRVANKSIANIDRLSNAKQEEKDDLLGQAYFVRAYAHFVLVRYFGGMPYLDKALSGDDDWDLPRLTSAQTLTLAANDFEKAYELLLKAGKMRRDSRPGSAGHLESVEMFYPNGVTAKAMKARALLYAASPLNNPENSAAMWEEAAKACGEAISVAEEWEYAMVPFENYTDNWFGVPYTNESLWTWNFGTSLGTDTQFLGLYAYPQSYNGNGGGICPTQNFVDRFETADGDMLYTAAQRTAAAAKGHYNEQSPYTNRDPRFEKVILHDGSSIPGFIDKVNIYYDPAAKKYPVTQVKTSIGTEERSFGINWGSFDNNKGSSNTGYYCRKFWNGASGNSNVRYEHSDPIIRMAELYLNYAEAVGEAYGPDATAGGCALTARAAVNKVRARAGMPEIRETDLAQFRERVRNERCVELAFEGHHYYSDIRRWKIAPQTMGETLTGMYIESCAVDAAHPDGRLYERKAIPSNRQCVWKDYMYLIPFPDAQARTMTKFVNNDPWM